MRGAAVRLVDGRVLFRCTLQEWAHGLAPAPNQDLLTKIARHYGATIPPLSMVAEDVPPVVARVAHGHWVADCECGGAEMVWLGDQPRLLFCGSCLNRRVARGLWRRIALPEDVAPIERLLLARGDPTLMNWTPAESVADLEAENAELAAAVERAEAAWAAAEGEGGGGTEP